MKTTPPADGYASPRVLGARLQLCRRVLGETIRDVEKATGISNPLISQIENGHVKEPGVFKIFKLAKHFNVPLDELLEA